MQRILSHHHHSFASLIVDDILNDLRWLLDSLLLLLCKLKIIDSKNCCDLIKQYRFCDNLGGYYGFGEL